MTVIGTNKTNSLRSKFNAILIIITFSIVTYKCTENTDAPMNDELNNANTIAYTMTSSLDEHIDNADTQATVTHTAKIVLDDNENDSETTTVNATDATDLNVNETNKVTSMDVIETTDVKAVDDLNNGTPDIK